MITIVPESRPISPECRPKIYARSECHDSHGQLICFLREDGTVTFNEPLDAEQDCAELRRIVANMLEQQERGRQERLRRALLDSDGD